MDKFENHIKDAFDSFEIPYNDADWTEMESKLDAINNIKTSSNTWYIIGALFLFISGGSLYYFNSQTNKEQLTTHQLTESKKDIPRATIIDNAPKPATSIDKKQTTSIPLQTTNTTTQTTENPAETINTSTKEEVLQQEIQPNEEVLKQEIPSQTTENKSSSKEIKLFTLLKTSICSGENVPYKLHIGSDFKSYSWYVNDERQSTEAFPNLSLSKTGHHVIQLKATDFYGQSFNYSQEITVIQSPEFTIQYRETMKDHDWNKIFHPYTNLSAEMNNNEQVTYSWDLGNGQSSSKQNPSIIYKKAASYNISLIVKSANGCSHKETKNVLIEKDFDFIKNTAFTPNNDGKNDFFLPKELLAYDIPFTLYIKDVNGKVIFTSNSKNNPWDGKDMNTGQMVPMGTYAWIITTEDVKKEKHNFIGKIKKRD